VQIRRGRIKVLGNFYDVRQATVSFSGEPQPDPAINVLLARRIADVEVLVGLQGTASTPELILRSNPPIYDRSQVLSLILTGRLDPKAGESENDQTMVLANAVSQVLIGNLTRKIAPKVGLDVARVNVGEQKDKETGESKIRAEAEVGKYLTERIYVGYRRVFGATAEENTNEGLLEYRISVKWLLMGLFGDAGVGGLDLMWTHRF
jgi:autotransporter translocation and assembly factor TamB